MNVNVTAADQIKSDRSAKTILVTGATGDTGRPTVKLLLEREHKVKALVHKDDERAQILRDQEADVVVGDMLDISSMRKAADGVSSAYFVYQMAAGQVEATALFAQVARERRLEMDANMSHKQACPYARSKATAAIGYPNRSSTGPAFQLRTSGSACLLSGYFISHRRSRQGGM